MAKKYILLVSTRSGFNIATDWEFDFRETMKAIESQVWLNVTMNPGQTMQASDGIVQCVQDDVAVKCEEIIAVTVKTRSAIQIPTPQQANRFTDKGIKLTQ